MFLLFFFVFLVVFVSKGLCCALLEDRYYSVSSVCVAKQLKEQEIKRQFQDVAKTQQKQYKAYRSHQLAKTSKAEQKEMLKRLKEEQLRRMAMLSQQYDASVAEMIEQQNVSILFQFILDHYCLGVIVPKWYRSVILGIKFVI